MILVDFNNVVFSGIMAQLHVLDGKFEENLIRHMVLMFFLSYKREYPNHGELVLCCDGSNPWRKDFFPHYKASRKPKEIDPEAAKVEGELDMEELWRILNTIREEMKNRMPYKVLHIPRCEGDDCIAVLAKYLPGPHCVVSNDKDFGQLQKIAGVIQYSPKKKNDKGNGEIIIENPELFLKEQIIRGDKIDDVPNILSDDDTFVNKDKRQKSIMSKKMDSYLSQDLENNFEKSKIDRNKKMIDFDQIPDEFINKILAEFEAQKTKKVNRQDIFQYFISKKLTRLMDSITNF